jgi:hypothetical protein
MNKNILVLLSVLLGLAAPVIAQEAATPAAPERKPPANLRAWILNPSKDTRIQAKVEGAEEGVSLASASGGAPSFSPAYVQFPAGRLDLSLIEGEEPPRLSEALPLRSGSAYTLIAWISGAKWQIKVFPDTVAQGSSQRPLRALNFAEGRETLLSAGGGEEIKLADNSVTGMNVAARICDVRVKVLAADGGPPAQSTVEVDFATVPSAYVVVRPDYRGRMRPRVILGGAETEDAGAEAAAAGGEE